MIHKIKEISELYTESKVAEIKEIAVTADRLGLPDVADKIFALHFEIKKSLAKTANAFVGMKKLIKTIEVAEACNCKENVISEMRFEKSFPIINIMPSPDQPVMCTERIAVNNG